MLTKLLEHELNSILVHIDRNVKVATRESVELIRALTLSACATERTIGEFECCSHVVNLESVRVAAVPACKNGRSDRPPAW